MGDQGRKPQLSARIHLPDAPPGDIVDDALVCIGRAVEQKHIDAVRSLVSQRDPLAPPLTVWDVIDLISEVEYGGSDASFA